MRYLLIFIPALMAMAIAMRDQYGRKNMTASVLLTVTSILVMMRFSILAHFFDTGDRSVMLLVMEHLSSMFIMPFTYMFLCDQCGTRWNNQAAIFMLCLPALSMFSLVQGTDQIDWRSAIVIAQCVTIALCMGRLWKRIKVYGMEFSRQLKVYFIWMALLLAFTIFSFALGMDRSNGVGSQWSFFIYYTVVIASGYLTIPYSFRVKPVVNDNDDDNDNVNENVNVNVNENDNDNDDKASVSVANNNEEKGAEISAFDDDDENVGLVKLSEHLVEAMHHLMEEEKYYLQPNINIDDVALKLGTNRTYVTRLMRQEYGLTFIEYVNVARIQYSQKLLYTDHESSLEEIATKSGFTSASNYCRAFKRYTGTTPKGWLHDAAQ